MFKVISTAIVSASLLVAAPALAQDAMSVSVETADLDLSSDAGRARLERRVKAAADSICDLGLRDVKQRASYLACKSDVLASAELRMNELAARAGTGKIQLARAR